MDCQSYSVQADIRHPITTGYVDLHKKWGQRFADLRQNCVTSCRFPDGCSPKRFGTSLATRVQRNSYSEIMSVQAIGNPSGTWGDASEDLLKRLPKQKKSTQTRRGANSSTKKMPLPPLPKAPRGIQPITREQFEDMCDMDREKRDLALVQMALSVGVAASIVKVTPHGAAVLLIVGASAIPEYYRAIHRLMKQHCTQLRPDDVPRKYYR
jgi:hypothetical protein